MLHAKDLSVTTAFFEKETYLVKVEMNVMKNKGLCLEKFKVLKALPRRSEDCRCNAGLV